MVIGMPLAYYRGYFESTLFNYSRAVAKALLLAEPNGQLALSKIAVGAGYRPSEPVPVFGCKREDCTQPSVFSSACMAWKIAL
jgi:hypothetical protein